MSYKKCIKVCNRKHKFNIILKLEKTIEKTDQDANQLPLMYFKEITPKQR